VIFEKQARLPPGYDPDAMKLKTVLCALEFLGFLGAFAQTNHPMNGTQHLSGTWSCVSAIVDCKTLTSETTALLRLTLTENRYKTDKGSEVLFDSTYTVNSSKNPKQINMVGTEGDLTGKEALGIYSIEGDALRMCYVMPGLPRPERFESPPGSKCFLVIWQRDPH
jgi:uncharacterized protein (TIGR03067 family)